MKTNKHLTVRGKLKDRGRTKWTAMMLPEHVQMLRDWQEENEAVPKPVLETADLDALAEEIRLAQQTRSLIEIRVWRDNRFLSLTGHIHEIRPERQQLVLTDDHRQHVVYFREVVGATAIG